MSDSALRGRLRQPNGLSQSGYISRPSVYRSWDIISAGTTAPKNQSRKSEVVSILPQVAAHRPPAVVPSRSEKLRPARVYTADRTLEKGNRIETAARLTLVRRVSNLNRTQLLLVGMACMLFAVGIFTSLNTLQTNRSNRQQVSALSAAVDNGGGSADPSTVSETKPAPKSVSSYRVAGNLPQTLKIPKIGVDARIRPMGVNSKSELAAPPNIYDAGWYNASAKPGDNAAAGALLIDGHVHGPTLPGIFVNLKKLGPGDTIEVIRGDGKTFEYTVVKSDLVDADAFDMAAALTSVTPGQAGLNLVTCGGTYNTSTKHYEQRTFVRAVLKS